MGAPCLYLDCDSPVMNKMMSITCEVSVTLNMETNLHGNPFINHFLVFI